MGVLCVVHQECEERVRELKVTVRPSIYIRACMLPSPNTIAMIATKPVAHTLHSSEGKAGDISNDDWIMIV